MNAKNYFSRLKEETKPVIVEVWATWCVPCRVMRPALEKVAYLFKERVEVWQIDADKNPEVVQALGVMGIPALIGYRNGEEGSPAGSAANRKPV